MIKYFLLVVVIMTFANMVNTQCPVVLQCQNGNVFNSNTCRCDCFPSYSGTFCETLNCSRGDPTVCVTFGAQNCGVSLIKNYCPRMCGTCPVTTIATTTTTTTLLSTTTPCPTFCLNEGALDIDGCACRCNFISKTC